MSESTSLGVMLSAALIADAVALNSAIAVPAGISALIVLFSFDQESPRGFGRSLAFSSCCGLSAAVAAGPLYSYLNGVAFGLTPPVAIWLGATILVFLIDMLRSGNRATQPVPSFRPLPQVPVEPAPSIAPRLFREDSPSSAPTTETPVSARMTSDPVATAPAQTASAASQPAPSPEAVPVRGGKPVSIYVNLVGEGMNMLRAVRAEHVGRDFYLIADEMPENERWEFTPGQVVRCQKRNLSSGKALVAVQEAPRA